LQEEIKSVGVLAFLAKPETKESREEIESKESVNDET
jgi:hypothetical protein